MTQRKGEVAARMIEREADRDDGREQQVRLRILNRTLEERFVPLRHLGLLLQREFGVHLANTGFRQWQGSALVGATQR